MAFGDRPVPASSPVGRCLAPSACGRDSGSARWGAAHLGRAAPGARAARQGLHVPVARRTRAARWREPVPGDRPVRCVPAGEPFPLPTAGGVPGAAARAPAGRRRGRAVHGGDVLPVRLRVLARRALAAVGAPDRRVRAGDGVGPVVAAADRGRPAARGGLGAGRQADRGRGALPLPAEQMGGGRRHRPRPSQRWRSSPPGRSTGCAPRARCRGIPRRSRRCWAGFPSWRSRAGGSPRRGWSRRWPSCPRTSTSTTSSRSGWCRGTRSARSC
jgi:hypothetical protein